MIIFYGHSAGKAAVPAESPVEASLETDLAVFRGLDALRGFLGVILDQRSTLQLLLRRDGTRVELLDTSRPAFDACVTDAEFAESLLHAVADGRDVFGVAQQRRLVWEHTDLA